ncbi:MAG: hydroxyethylthiazole kinase [Candidatus Omnitrophota bacterium]
MDIYSILERVRAEKPLVHHLTNWVTIYDCANIVKALGASPVMAHAKEESGDMANLASSLVLNIGTLTPEFIESMKIAAHSANKKGIPVVLDVCGAGATRLRDEKSFELLNETRINIIKGNASEIARIAGEDVQTKGVDSAEVKKNLVELARQLAGQRNAIVVITGKEDIIADKARHFIVRNGHEMMTHVVGTGCMAASVIGAFSAVHKDLAEAAAGALSIYGIAAELAAKGAKGPATFKEKLFDNIYRLDRETIERMQKIE